MLLVRKTNPLLTRWLTRRLPRNQEVDVCVDGGGRGFAEVSTVVGCTGKWGL